MRALRATTLLASASVAEAASAFAIGVVVARSGGPVALGRLSVAMAALLAALTASELGQNVVLTRRTASGDRARAGLGASLFLKAVLGVALAAVVVLAWPGTEPPWGAFCAAVLLLLSSWTISLTAVLRGLQRFGDASRPAWVAAIASATAVAALRPTRVSEVLAVLAMAQAIKLALCWRALPDAAFPALPRGEDVRALAAETMPFAALVLLGVAYFKADVLLLSALRGAEEAGRYAAAARLVEALKIAPAALGSALFPALAAGREDDLRHALRAALVLGTMVVAVVLLAGSPLTTLVFGSAFGASVAPLRLLGAAFCLSSVSGILLVALYARRRESSALGALAAALAINVAANLLLIPGRGATGAAGAAVVSEAVLVGLYVRGLRRIVRTSPPAAAAGALVLAGPMGAGGGGA